MITTRANLTTRSVQADLRQVFSQWGLPDAIRIDRYPIFVGSTRLEWPKLLLLTACFVEPPRKIRCS